MLGEYGECWCVFDWKTHDIHVMFEYCQGNYPDFSIILRCFRLVSYDHLISSGYFRLVKYDHLWSFKSLFYPRCFQLNIRPYFSSVNYAKYDNLWSRFLRVQKGIDWYRESMKNLKTRPKLQSEVIPCFSWAMDIRIEHTEAESSWVNLEWIFWKLKWGVERKK